MSAGYIAGARRAPNVSQYLADLNTIPSAQELAAGQQQQSLDFAGDDLDFFTNAEFIDFDTFNGGGPVDAFAAGGGHGGVDGSGGKGMVMNGPQYPPFNDFQTFPSTVASTPTNLPPTAGPYTHTTPPSGLAYTQPQLTDPHGTKPTAADLEEQSRAAAEEDKRRRNTAASARFRVKKKQREQALEKQNKELNDKLAALEGKVKQLEMENTWLKGLITEKGGAGEEGGERSRDGEKRGIGTEDAEGSEE